MATVLADGFGFVEGPRWHNGQLWFADIPNGRVHALDMYGNLSTVIEVPGGPSGMGWLPDGRLLVTAVRERKLMRLDAVGELVEHADLTGIATGHCNDMVVDDNGRAYVGNFGFDLGEELARVGDEGVLGLMREPELPTAALASVDPYGNVAVAATGLRFPNGMIITPDGKALIVAESLGQRLTAYDIDSDGSLTNRRVWAMTPPDTGPDGICLDADGAAWVAVGGGEYSACLRMAEGGEILDRIETTDPIYACMLGGPDRKSLYLCVNRPNGRSRGRIEMVTVDVPGTGLP